MDNPYCDLPYALWMMLEQGHHGPLSMTHMLKPPRKGVFFGIMFLPGWKPFDSIMRNPDGSMA